MFLDMIKNVIKYTTRALTNASVKTTNYSFSDKLRTQETLNVDKMYNTHNQQS